jgi:hypothetical protein
MAAIRPLESVVFAMVATTRALVVDNFSPVICIRALAVAVLIRFATTRAKAVTVTTCPVAVTMKALAVAVAIRIAETLALLVEVFE